MITGRIDRRIRFWLVAFRGAYDRSGKLVKDLNTDQEVMQHAICIARKGFGHVEPNPMVGAVIISETGEWIAGGYHQEFGKAHAEINAIAAAGERTRGSQLFVTLEPCSHFGKTPPCADAVIAARFRRVVVGCQDPAPHVAGRGIQKLRDAGIDVVVGVCEADAKRLVAPFEMLLHQRRPWVHAKWAMTLDGRVATHTGHSQWISCDQSRAWVHDLRGRVDAIITGAGTVRSDDCRLTARPPGPRKALRLVMDSTGDSIAEDRQLVKTLKQAPVLVCVSRRCSETSLQRLQQLGVQVFQTTSTDHVDVAEVLLELGRRQCNHVLLEAGPRLLGAFFDAEKVDQVHVFVAPKLIGGARAVSPVGGEGLARIPDESNLTHLQTVAIGEDLLIEADVSRKAPPGDLQRKPVSSTIHRSG